MAGDGGMFPRPMGRLLFNTKVQSKVFSVTGRTEVESVVTTNSREYYQLMHNRLRKILSIKIHVNILAI